MADIDLRDVTVTVTLAEEESRFLAGLVHATAPHLTGVQRMLAERIAVKFALQGEATKHDLIERYGLTAVLDMAERAMLAYPDVEDVTLDG